MQESLVVISSSISALATVFLYLYFKKFQEVLELKDKVRRLQALEEHDQEIQRVRDDFLAMLVHELRAPLSVVRGSADLLIRETTSMTQKQISDLLGQIRSSSSELLNLVNDLLDVSKLESGGFELFKRDIDLNEVLMDELHRFEMLAKEKGITLEGRLDPRLSSAIFDPERIRQVINNLLSNALKFTPSPGKVYLNSEKIDDKVKISVDDSGKGVPEDIKGKLFHKFVQGRSNGTADKGTGLGLFISKGIVEAHGGNIWVEDNKPQGSKFVFTLPL